MSDPDPLFSANLYAAGYIDSAIVNVVGPIRDRARQLDSRADVWLMRYARRGEHLKIRVHGPANIRAELEPFIPPLIDGWLTELPEADPEAGRRSISFLAPIDDQDQGQEDVPDRSWIATDYRRNALSFGVSPMLESDEHVRRMVACLAAGTDLLLEHCELGDGDRFPNRALQSLALKAVMLGLAAAGFNETERLTYLSYHRDWLMRSRLKNKGRDRLDTGQEFLDRFEKVAVGMADGLSQLGAKAEHVWQGGIEAVGEQRLERRWFATIDAVCVGLKPWEHERPDPFSRDIRFPVLFKILHGFGNQLGLDRLNEALTYHLMQRALGREPGPIRFVPEDVGYTL